MSTDKYIKEIISNLCERFNYRVVELNTLGGISSWATIKNEVIGGKVLIFLDGSTSLSPDTYKNIKDEVSAKTGIMPLELVEVRLYQNYNQSVNSAVNSIGINYVTNEIMYYTSDKVAAEELANCLAYIDYEKKHKQKSKVKGSTVTFIIIALNVIMFLITAYFSQSIIDSDARVLVALGAKFNPLIKRGQYYRLFTCMFLHGGIIHLVLNMYALYSLGPLVEEIYGKYRYIVIYVISGIISSTFSYMFSSSISVGASGAIFGLFGAALVFALKNKDRISKQFLINILQVIVINLVIGFSIANVDNFGHIGGLIGGIVSSYILYGLMERRS